MGYCRLNEIGKSFAGERWNCDVIASIVFVYSTWAVWNLPPTPLAYLPISRTMGRTNFFVNAAIWRRLTAMAKGRRLFLL